jgi:UDP-N-acetylglucosamine--N-acetylmuramyl-(pentapeptide) pyrophosphoryl-undecaprenol N-acetylglucosamine transferase
MIVAGGGTGGHVFPGIALAEAFLDACPGGIATFVGTKAGLEATVVPSQGFAIDFVPSGQVWGRGIRAVPGLLRIARGFPEAMSVLKRRRPDLVFGVGGYASVPVALAAAWLRIPLFLQEQNSVPGRSNRLLSRYATRVFTGFAGAVPSFPPGRSEVTGNPVRSGIVAAARERRYDMPPDDPFTVLALGGSRGARTINSRVLEMARRSRREERRIRFLLQTGAGDYDSVRDAVTEGALPIEAFPFTDRIDERFVACHAVVMRAGASSIAEAALFGKPCVLVPYPHAADDHQARNAQEFCEAGAGVWMAESAATEAALWEALWALGGDRAARERAAAAARRFARPDAARETIGKALALCGAGARRENRGNV